MPNSATNQRSSAASESLEHRLEFSDFLAKLPPKDRVNAQKRVEVLEASPYPGLAGLWRRLACALMTLSPHAAKLVGRQTVQYYVADGRYRMQVFALEDVQDGNVTIYCPDVLAEALQASVVVQPANVAPDVFGIVGSREQLRIELLDRSSINPAAHFKDMVGWNRKALRITLQPAASAEQVAAAELLCAIAAQHFARPAAGVEGGTAK